MYPASCWPRYRDKTQDRRISLFTNTTRVVLEPACWKMDTCAKIILTRKSGKATVQLEDPRSTDNGSWTERQAA